MIIIIKFYQDFIFFPSIINLMASLNDLTISLLTVSLSSSLVILFSTSTALLITSLGNPAILATFAAKLLSACPSINL